MNNPPGRRCRATLLPRENVLREPFVKAAGAHPQLPDAHGFFRALSLRATILAAVADVVGTMRMTPHAFVGALSLVVLSFGCGGKVIVEAGPDGHATDDDEPIAGRGGSAPAGGGGASGVGGGGTAGWGPKFDPCVSCSVWFDGCNGEGLCPHPDSVCGAEQDLVLALLECMCAGCAEICGGSCVMFNQSNADCFACQTGILIQTCGIEYFDCVGS